MKNTPTLKVRIEQSIPKLLVKVSPPEATRIEARNLGEVTLTKQNGGRAHVAVLHVSHNVAPGEVVISLKLAEILDVHDSDVVELQPGAISSRAPKAHAPVAGKPAVPLFGQACDSLSSDDAYLRANKPSSKWTPEPQPPTAGLREPFGEPSLASSAERVPRSHGPRTFDPTPLPTFDPRAAERGFQTFDPARSHGPRAFDPTPLPTFDPMAAERSFPTFDPGPSSLPTAPTHSDREGVGDPVWGDSPLHSEHAYDPNWGSSLGSDAAPASPSKLFADSLGGRFSRSHFSASEHARVPRRHSEGGLHAQDADFGFSGASHRHGPTAHTGDYFQSSPQAWQRDSDKPDARRPGISSLFEDFQLPSYNSHVSSGAPHRHRAATHTGDNFQSSAQARQRDSDKPEARPSRISSLFEDFQLPSYNTQHEPPKVPFAEEPLRHGSRLGFQELHQSFRPVQEDKQQEHTQAGPGLPSSKHKPVDSLPASERSRTPADAVDAGTSRSDDAAVDDESLRESVQTFEDVCRRLRLQRMQAALAPDERAQADVWAAPPPQRRAPRRPLPQGVAASLEPSPLHSERSSRGSRSPSLSSSQGETPHAADPLRQLFSPMHSDALPAQAPFVATDAAESRSLSPVSLPEEGRFRAASPGCYVPRGAPPAAPPGIPPGGSLPEEGRAAPQQEQRGEPLWARPPGSRPSAIVPCTAEEQGSAGPARKSSSLLNRRRSMSLGLLSAEALDSPRSHPQQPIPPHWRGIEDKCGGLERSELGHEVTVEVKRWLTGDIGGPQCSQVVMDRALTVLANFKLASGCHLETLGGPLGAIVGGFSSADWLHEDVFAKSPATAVQEGFQLLGLKSRGEGDWSHIPSEEVSLAYRRLCLKGHPSRGGPPRAYLKLQVAMELVRALSEEAGPLWTPVSQPLAETPPPSRSRAFDKDGFILTDVSLAKELKLTSQEAEAEAASLSQEELEDMNRALDEYILRLMCFKSEIVDEIARLHENCAYAILGVSADASDSEIKKAYRLIAMQCHPDKGGDKEDFQELHNAYEKIMEQRRVMSEAFGKHRYDFDEDPVEKSEAPTAAQEPEEEVPEPAEEEPAEPAEELHEPKNEDEAEESSNAALVDKAAKAAEEAARYAKTAQDFAAQAVEAAETARKGKEQGSRDQLTKSTAHSAIVLTLIVVKAVRVVGYATLDVAAQCRIAAKRNPLAEQCADRAVTAMGLGLEALNSTLTCAEVTETTAAELQAAGDPDGEHDAERFVNAAVRASNAAQSASNAAVAAATAAAEGSRDCIRALEVAARAAEPEPAEDDLSDAEESQPASPPKPPKPEPLSQEQLASNAHRRLVSQRNNNHKVLQRLNAEILSHQVNVRNILHTNRLLLPEVTGKSKAQVFDLLAGYVDEARQDLFRLLSDSQDPWQALVEGIQHLGMFIPFLQSQTLAISVCVKARVLKMAALFDFALAVRLIDEQVFAPILAAIPASRADTLQRIRALQNSVKEELQANVSEDSLREAAATSSSE